MTNAITTYCNIKDWLIKIDGQTDFSSDEKEFRKFIRAAYRNYKTGYPKFFKMDNLSKLGFLTADILIKRSGIADTYAGEEIGIILSNSSSSLDTDEKHQETINDKDNYFPSPSMFVYTLPNIMAGEISIRHKIKGENAVFIFERFNPEFLYSYITELMAGNKLKCCLGGWVDYYQDHYESFLFLVEQTETVKRGKKAGEYIIFAPKNLEKLFKG